MAAGDEIVVNVTLDWRVVALLVIAVALGAIMISTAGAQDGPTLNEGAGDGEQGEGAGERSNGAASGATAGQQFVGLRSFYQTDANYSTDEALTACAEGYHMASLWEIMDVSNLAYAYEHPDAFTRADSGQGPPSNWYGWVRTGGVQSASGTAGTGNCVSWTSTDPAHYGAAVRLSADWEAPGTAVSPWDANAATCNLVGPVWCVQD